MSFLTQFDVKATKAIKGIEFLSLHTLYVKYTHPSLENLTHNIPANLV